MNKIDDLRVYNPKECAVFCKTKDLYGEFSNMAGGFSLTVNNIDIKTSEALYQSLRFPCYPEIQRNIIDQKSPMTAKMKGKPFRNTHTRSDWQSVRVMLMRWTLRVKLLQNWEEFSKKLLETEDLPIVELSSKGDDFWGTVIVKEVLQSKKMSMVQRKYPPSKEFPVGFLVGYNVLGRLIMELRQRIKLGRDPMSHDFMRLKPLDIPSFLLYGEKIGDIVRK